MSKSITEGDRATRWQDFAACHGVALRFFYAEDHERGAETRFNRAKQLYCQKCPVRAECLEEAFRNGDRYALMGGMTPDERDATRRQSTQYPKSDVVHDDTVVAALVSGETVPGATRIDIAHACVQLWRLGGISRAALCRRFGVTEGSVRIWIRRADRGEPPISPTWWSQHHREQFTEVL